MTNIDYFNFSLENNDEIVDFSNPKGELVISENLQNLTNLQNKNIELIELISAYKTIKNSKNFTKKNLEEIVIKIIEILENVKYINYSPFCAYFPVIKYSFNAFLEQKSNLCKSDKIILFSKIIESYISNRHNIYRLYGYSDLALQTAADMASSRRNSKTGINKMIEILPKEFLYIKEAKNFIESDFAYLLPDKGDKNAFNEILNNNKIEFIFRKNRQNKNPDMLLKIKEHLFIIEHKLTNGDGGSQNMEINEIIEFIKQNENSNNIYYLSCLQGNFFQKLNNAKNNIKVNKNKKQYADIILYLNNFKNNFFVNGKGFAEIVKNFSK